MKRFFDFFLSLLMIIILSPFLGLIALIILITSGRPVLFVQERVGYNNRLFNIYKFRSMKKGTRQTNTAGLTDEEVENQITAFGRFLRKTSLDEIPQIFNILNGTMSFVGPRPLIPEETEIRKIREKYNVYSVRPGMTGLAQVNGRDLLSDEEKAEFDREYVENKSLWLDIKILFKTVWTVLLRKDITDGNTVDGE